MEELSWSYQDLMECPYEKYLDYARIMTLEKKEEKKESDKMESKVN